MLNSVNCSTVIRSPTVKIPMLLREATSETYGPLVYLHHINLPILSYFYCFYFTFCSINQKYQKYYFTIYPSISDLTLQITVKVLTTPYHVGCELVFVCAGTRRLVCSLLLDCYLGSKKLRKILTLLGCITLFSSRENQRSAQEVARTRLIF